MFGKKKKKKKKDGKGSNGMFPLYKDDKGFSE